MSEFCKRSSVNDWLKNIFADENLGDENLEGRNQGGGNMGMKSLRGKFGG